LNPIRKELKKSHEKKRKTATQVPLSKPQKRGRKTKGAKKGGKNHSLFTDEKQRSHKTSQLRFVVPAAADQESVVKHVV